jgi:hypothetical protein
LGRPAVPSVLGAVSAAQDAKREDQPSPAKPKLYAPVKTRQPLVATVAKIEEWAKMNGNLVFRDKKGRIRMFMGLSSADNPSIFLFNETGDRATQITAEGFSAFALDISDPNNVKSKIIGYFEPHHLTVMDGNFPNDDTSLNDVKHIGEISVNGLGVADYSAKFVASVQATRLAVANLDAGSPNSYVVVGPANVNLQNGDSGVYLNTSSGPNVTVFSKPKWSVLTREDLTYHMSRPK